MLRANMFLLRKCCFCVDLRLGCFIIGYLMLILRVSVLVITSVRISQESQMIQHGVHSILVQDAAFHRLTSVISFMILVFETLLTIALIVGLTKRLDQHLEMYFVGSFAFMVMGMVLYAVVLMRYAQLFGGWAWVIVAIEICLKMIVIYFLFVVRSYYYKMKEEAKEDERRLDGKQPTSYFARTKPALISNKP